MFEECVDERDVAGDALLGGERLQLVAILLALVRDEVRMRRAEHHVQQVGMLRDHRGQRVDDRLDPFVGSEQAERQHDLVALPAELALEYRGVEQVAIGHAVRNHGDLTRIGAVDTLEDIAAALGHHHNAGGAAEQAFEHAALIGIGLFEDRVQRDDHRQRGSIEQREDMLAGGAAEDAIFVLEPDRLRAAGLDLPRGVDVGRQIGFGDRAGHLGRIVVFARMIVHRVDIDGDLGKARAHGRENVGRESGEPTLPRQEITDQRQSRDIPTVRRFHHTLSLV